MDLSHRGSATQKASSGASSILFPIFAIGRCTNTLLNKCNYDTSDKSNSGHTRSPHDYRLLGIVKVCGRIRRDPNHLDNARNSASNNSHNLHRACRPRAPHRRGAGGVERGDREAQRSVGHGRPALLARREQGFNTTFYICCNPLFPNTFSFSNPFEAELLGWYGLACDYDGILRWAYNSWPADPERDSRYGNWSSGDTYLIYPHARSSVRFERLIDGIEVAEKVRTLRRLGVDTSAVDAVLQRILAADINDPREPWQQLLTDARTALDSLSRQ